MYLNKKHCLQNYQNSNDEIPTSDIAGELSRDFELDYHSAQRRFERAIKNNFNTQ